MNTGTVTPRLFDALQTIAELRERVHSFDNTVSGWQLIRLLTRCDTLETEAVRMLSAREPQTKASGH